METEHSEYQGNLSKHKQVNIFSPQKTGLRLHHNLSSALQQTR